MVIVDIYSPFCDGATLPGELKNHMPSVLAALGSIAPSREPNSWFIPSHEKPAKVADR
jgi:hypothetical protein